MISVIIPVYNTIDYFRECLDSVMSQTFNDYEVIIVDDGSTDGSGNVADEYASRYINVRVIHKENEGLVLARKTGVNEAKGEYISFVDSDDWVDNNFLESLFSAVNSVTNGADLATSNHTQELIEGNVSVECTVNEGVYDKAKIYEEIIPKFFWDYKYQKPGISAAVWSKLFRKELLIDCQKNIDSRITLGEDAAITFPMMLKSECVVITHYAGYHYRQLETSMAHSSSPEIYTRLSYIHDYLMNYISEYDYKEWLYEQVECYIDMFLSQILWRTFKRKLVPLRGEQVFLDFIPLNSRIVLYGAGERGKKYYKAIGYNQRAKIVAWLDKSEPRWPMQMKVERPEVIKHISYDYVVVAVAKKETYKEIRNNLIELGVDGERILWNQSLLAKNPEYIKLTDNTIDTIREYRHVYIYGAGDFGKELFDKLSFVNICVDAFIVSEEVKDRKKCRGRNIINIDKWTGKNKKGNLAVIAISPKRQNEILRILETRGIRNYITLSPIRTTGEEDIWMSRPIQNNKIFFDTFRGLGYLGNPKYIAEALIKSEFDIVMVWDVTGDANMEFPKSIHTVKRGDPEFYREYYTSHIVVTNMNSVMALKKRKGQYYLNTWHGTGPFKKVGKYLYDVNHDVKAYEIMKREYEDVDFAIAACRQCLINHIESFEYKGEIQKWGYPRNDIFFLDPKPIRKRICKRLGINYDSIIVLYAPTFRYSVKKKTKNLSEVYDLDLDKVSKSIEKRFGKKATLLYRFHQYIYRTFDVSNYYPHYLDVTMYPDMQELLVTADVLITDWSSSIWDYSLTRKPVFLYFNDAEAALKENGFYVEPDDLPYPKGHNTEEFCKSIENFEESAYLASVEEFIQEYDTYDDGHASEKVAGRIIDVILNPDKY